MNFRLRTCTPLAVVRFEAVILLVFGLPPLGVTLLVLALSHPGPLDLAQMTVVGCVAIDSRYMPSPLGHRFESKATRVPIDATAFHAVVEPDLAMLLVGKEGF